MKYLPLSLDLKDRPVTVIGGGQVAARRVEALLECGAAVTVVGPEPSVAILRLAEAGRLVLLHRAYRRGDLEGARLVMTATDDPEVNRSVWHEARELGIWINVADEPSRCDFIMPSVVRRGDLTVAVSTSGRAPALAARLRQRIARIVGPEYERLVDVLDQARTIARERAADPEERRRLQYRLVDSDLIDLIRHGNDAAVGHRVDEVLGGLSARGIVYIVGAGPGDPGLITVRGIECVSRADVILHDRLISRRVLDAAGSGAEIIDVGKRAGDEGRMQRSIEETMIRRARAGDVVCRLKGGDPFVFGRGGEEARALTAAAVAWEIVPGVSSATAVPAAAGIPVTHRDIAHSFLVMTGSRAEYAGMAEWAGAAELLKAGGTVVVLMGLRHLEKIAARLRDAGCPEDMPAAVISHGTLPDQDVRVATVGTIAAGGRPESPGILVFGTVVEERRRLREIGEAGGRLPKSPG